MPVPRARAVRRTRGAARRGTPATTSRAASRTASHGRARSRPRGRAGAAARTPAALPAPAARTALPPALPEAAPADGTVNELIRWAAFGCAVVPFVLLLCGLPCGVALAATAGLAAVTAASRALLRHSERVAARPDPDAALPHRGRHGRTGIGAHRGGRRG
ncbi:hypothetical protein [Streptomyces cucumeris]|uniref:hypothetical protein n=1 Tax=Streptomyces cucumeris TaxID=2962890 RepID=UPI003D7091E9